MGVEPDVSGFWEYKELTFPHDVPRGEVKTVLTGLADVERWELDRVRVFHNGRRWVRLRRKAYNLRLTA